MNTPIDRADTGLRKAIDQVRSITDQLEHEQRWSKGWRRVLLKTITTAIDYTFRGISFALGIYGVVALLDWLKM